MKLLLAVLFAALAWAQTPEIRGVVIEPGVEHGVPDADVAIFEVGANPVTGLGREIRRQAGRVTTDSQGKFRFQPQQFGVYLVTASKEGYTDSGGVRAASATRAGVTLSAEHPSSEVRLLLSRTGEITGRVIDEETGEPLANYRIEADGFSYRNGVPVAAGSGTLANTDDDGRFVVPGLDPGRYVVATHPRMRGLTRFADDQRETRDYEWAYWPGGHGLDAAAPVTLISGGSADVGEVRLRKAPLYRAHIAIEDANCPIDEAVQASVYLIDSQSSRSYGSSAGACGQELVLWNLQPGSYGLVLTHGPDGSMASLTFDIVNRDLNLKASLAPTANISGRVIAADGASKIKLEQLRVMAVGVARAGQAGQVSPAVPVDSAGHFELASSYPFGKSLIWLIAPAGASEYMSQMRFNGRIVTGDAIALDGSLGSQSVEIVVDNRPASLTGVVQDGERPVSKSYVLLVQWPLPAGFAYLPPEGADADDDGQFRLTGLAPGEYRAIAVFQSKRDLLDEPGVLQRLLSDAETIRLGRGDVQAVTLKLSDPAR